MRKSFALSLLITISPLMLIGCSYDRFVSLSEHEKGTKVTPSQFSSFIPGKTASSTVQQILGKPSKIQRKSGREIWVYTYQRFNSNPMIASQNSSHAVFLEFDAKGVLVRRWKKDILPDIED